MDSNDVTMDSKAITIAHRQTRNEIGTSNSGSVRLQEYQKAGRSRSGSKRKFSTLETEKTVNVLRKVYGIDREKALSLVTKNITTVEELKRHPEELNEAQKFGLRYYHDIVQRIPRLEMNDFKVAFEATFKRLTPPESKLEVVGSYRRGSKDSSCITILITVPDNNTDAYHSFLNTLLKEKLLIEMVSLGRNKSIAVGKLPVGKTLRRINFFYSPPNEYVFAKLYYTGSMSFGKLCVHLRKGPVTV